MIARNHPPGFRRHAVAARRHPPVRATAQGTAHALVFLFTGLPFFVLASGRRRIGWLAVKAGTRIPDVVAAVRRGVSLLMVFELLTIVSLQDRKISAPRPDRRHHHGKARHETTGNVPKQESTARILPFPGQAAMQPDSRRLRND